MKNLSHKKSKKTKSATNATSRKTLKGKNKTSYCWWAAPVISLCGVIIAFAIMRAVQVREQRDPFPGERRRDFFALYAIISDLKSQGFGH